MFAPSSIKGRPSVASAEAVSWPTKRAQRRILGFVVWSLERMCSMLRSAPPPITDGVRWAIV